jgi:hypothetical protein
MNEGRAVRRVSPLRAVKALLAGDAPPEGFTGVLERDERLLAHAPVTGGGHLVVTSWGLWVPGEDGHRRVGWHRVSKAVWRNGEIVLVEADDEEVAPGVALLTDRPPRRLRLPEPGRVPEVVHERVTGSIRTRHHRDLPGGGAWFVQRRIAGRDGVVLQVRPDPGTDAELVRALAVEVARSLPARP